VKRSHRLLRPLVAAALVPLSLLAPAAAGASTGDASDNGLWYYTATGLEQLHERSTGAGIKIAVIDSAVNTAAPDLVGANVRVREPAYCALPDGSPAPAVSTDEGARHGTHIAALIAGTGAGTNGEPGTMGVAPGAEVEVFATAVETETKDVCTPANYSRLFQDAVMSGADIINVSGKYNFSAEDMLAALRADVIVVGSAGNEGATVGFPATFNGAVTVGTLAPDLSLAQGSPLGGGVDVVAPGADIRGIAPGWQQYGRTTGSSDAAAFTSGALALVWSLHPDATPRQIMQSLVRSTGGTEHEPVIEDVALGYGVVNVRQMLDSDPRSYPDVNPFIEDDENAIPSITAVREAIGEAPPSRSPTPTAEPSRDAVAPDASAEGPDEPSSAGPLVLGVVIAIAIVIAAAAVGVALKRRRRGGPASTDLTNTPGGHDG
jgi:hypothetical protein